MNETTTKESPVSEGHLAIPPIKMDTASFQRWVIALLVGLIIGILSGQYTPNRNIVTNDQLEKQITPLTLAIAAQTIEISGLRDQLSEIRGELAAQKLLSSAKP